jgi:hypothetical protein
MYIENTCTLLILQISNGYHKVFQDPKSADMLEISAILKDEKGKAISNPALSHDIVLPLLFM